MKRTFPVPITSTSPWPVPDGFFYCGSHNFSYSAWGKLIPLDQFGRSLEPKKDDKMKSTMKSTPQVETRPTNMALKICNFELGVIIPNSDLNQTDLHKLLHCAPQYSKVDLPWSTPTNPDLQAIQYTPVFDPRPSSGFEFQDLPPPDTPEPFYAEEPEHFSSADFEDRWETSSYGIQGPVYSAVPTPNSVNQRPPTYAERHMDSQNIPDGASTCSHLDFEDPSDVEVNWTPSESNSPLFTALTSRSPTASLSDFEISLHAENNSHYTASDPKLSLYPEDPLHHSLPTSHIDP